MELDGKRIVVTGAHGFLGRHLCDVLTEQGISFTPLGRSDYDLMEAGAVGQLFRDHKPEVFFHLAGYVGGILANKQYPADFVYKNLLINTLTFHGAYEAGVEKMVCVMGGCSYPAQAPNPIKEESMWEGYPQAESAPYSVAKKMLIVQSESYRGQYGFNSIVMVPGNLYGPYDNFHLNNSHVIPALVRKVYEAKQNGVESLTMWGTGAPIRDFIYARDAAEALVKAAWSYDRSDIINISSGHPTTIRDLVETAVRLTQFKGEIIWDDSKPDGQMFKGFDVTRMREWLEFEPQTSLEEGLMHTINWFKDNQATARL